MALNLSHLDGLLGFRLDGANDYDFSGVSVASAGDVNGDGFDDLLVGANGADANGASHSGASYVVFGTDAAFPASLSLADLDGSNGFRLNGINIYDSSGRSVAGAGDVNGDGIDDLIVGADGADPEGAAYAGESYVVFGTDAGFPASLDLADLDGSNGFRLNGIDAYDRSGYSVAGAGDVNGDGIDDIVVGAPYAAPGGESYVVFGTDTGFAATVDLGELDGSNGFCLNGVDDYDESGRSVAGAGDVNGDGVDDLIVGAPMAGERATGTSYVVFGTATGFAATLDLADLNGSNGFRLEGARDYDYSGYLIASAGDVNGDGIGDLIVGAKGAPYGSNGESYVVFGTDTGLAASMALADLNGSDGFRLGANPYDATTVAGAGDLNGDGFDDLVVGVQTAGGYATGASYVVFGSDAVFEASLDLAVLDSSAGFRIDGIDAYDRSGGAVAGAGDVNGDGYDDLIVGASGGDPDGAFRAGESYVIFGSAQLGGVNDAPLAAADLLQVGTLDRVDLTADNGAGSDHDPDFDDLTIVAIDGKALAPGDSVTLASGLRVTLTGATEVRFDAPSISLATILTDSFSYEVSDGRGGSASTVTTVRFAQSAMLLADINGSNGFRIDGAAADDYSGAAVAGAGDVNGDGFDDVIVGVPRADVGSTYFTGVSYVVFGSGDGYAPSLDLAVLDGSDGFRLEGIESGDRSGSSVAGAGDVNGDGIDDIIIGANGAARNGASSVGESYVVFGTNVGFAASLSLADLDGSNGFRLEGIDAYDSSGLSVDGAGDVNGDGIDDLIIGAFGAYMNGASSVGESYVVFGTNAGFAASLDLANLDGSNGFRLDGVDASDFSGYSVAAAGDVNGDGIDDLIVGAPGANAGYIVFGTDTGFTASLDLSALDGSQGFSFGSNSGSIESVAGAGDINGDGLDDVIVGKAGYVVFGTDAGFPAHLDLAALDGSNGFRVRGADDYDGGAVSVSGAGDVNGDGIDDLIIAASEADPGGERDAGASYVVFGTGTGFEATFNLADLDGSNGFRLDGDIYDESGRSVAGAGDVNGDGFDDLIVGAPGADTNGRYTAGASYVVFGFATEEPLTPIFGGACDDVLTGSDENESFHPGGGRDRVTTGGGSDMIFFDDRVGKRDLLTITDFDALTDTLDLRGAAVAKTIECEARTVLILEGPDCDAVVLLGLSNSPLDLI